MDKVIKKLGEAELEIMQVIWDSEDPVTSNYILKELHGRRKFLDEMEAEHLRGKQ